MRLLGILTNLKCDLFRARNRVLTPYGIVDERFWSDWVTRFQTRRLSLNVLLGRCWYLDDRGWFPVSSIGDLQTAIKSFQHMHRPYGWWGDRRGQIRSNGSTWAFDDRLTSLAPNARVRLWPRDRDSLIVVNVPSFDMKYWEDGEEAFESKVVVGRKSRKTPLLEINLDSSS